jgi:predicted transcriptional regulator
MKIEEGNALLALDDPLVYGSIAVAVIIVCSIVIYSMRKRGKKIVNPPREERLKVEPSPPLPFKIVRSVSSEDASEAKEQLRILDLERGILSDAIRRLYEAQAEGIITEEERENLAQTYKSRMMTVKDAISKDESLVALHELEAMQEDLIKLFNERFDELITKIGELRSKVDVEPIKEIKIPIIKETSTPKLAEKPEGGEKAKRRKRAPSAKPSPRTEAEKRIEEIRAEVEKVLDKLGQMEIET